MSSRIEKIQSSLFNYGIKPEQTVEVEQAESIFQHMVQDVFLGKLQQRFFADMVAQWYFFWGYSQQVSEQNEALSWLMNGATEFGINGEEVDSIVFEKLKQFAEEPKQYYSWWDREFGSR